MYSGSNARHLGVRALKETPPIKPSNQQAIALAQQSDAAKAALLEVELQRAQENLVRERTLTAELKNRLLQLQVGFDEISSKATQLAKVNKQIQSDLNDGERRRSEQDAVFSDILEKAQDRLIVEIERRDRMIDDAHAVLAGSRETNLGLREELAAINTALQRSRYLQFKRWVGRLVGR